MEARTMVRNEMAREKEYQLGDEEYNGKIKKCAISSAKANKRGATGWKIWSDGYVVREEGTLISPESRPVFVSLIFASNTRYKGACSPRSIPSNPT